MRAVEMHREDSIHSRKEMAEVTEFDAATVLEGQAGDELKVVPAQHCQVPSSTKQQSVSVVISNGPSQWHQMY